MIDMDMDVGRAQIWLKEVTEELAQVEQTLRRVQTACQTVPGEEDTVFKFIEKTGNTMNSVWDTACNAYRTAWDRVNEGIEDLTNTGKKIVDLFENLKVR